MKTLAAGTLLALIQTQSAFFTTTLSVEEMESKQAVVETSMGSFVIEFLPRVIVSVTVREAPSSDAPDTIGLPQE